MKTKHIGPFGQGIGATVQLTGNPNKPSYDPAGDAVQTRNRMDVLVMNSWEKLSPLQRHFILRCYNQARPLTRRQYGYLARIEKELKETDAP